MAKQLAERTKPKVLVVAEMEVGASTITNLAYKHGRQRRLL